MSNYVEKYKIVYDGNDGFTHTAYIYCKHIGVSDSQKWCNEDGSPVNFDDVTDSNAYIKACCIAGIPTNDSFYYWEQIDEFTLPKEVAAVFNYKT